MERKGGKVEERKIIGILHHSLKNKMWSIAENHSE